MSIQTIFAPISCADIEVSVAWYSKLFNMRIRDPDQNLVVVASAGKS